MAARKVSKSAKKVNSAEAFRILANAFYEASRISFSLVFFPIVLLLIGVWADKKFGTIPIFIIAGIASGVFVGIYQATRIKMKVNSERGVKK